MISEIQSKKIRHFFSVLDNNGNGELQPDDFKNVARKICETIGIPENTKDYELTVLNSSRIFIQILTDLGKESLEITLEEWIHFFESNLDKVGTSYSPINAYITRTVQYIFNLFDENKDGHISIDEYVKMFMIYGIDTTHSLSSFAKLDLNEDSVISKKEMVKAFEEYFLSIDPESSGNWIFGNWDY